MIKTFKKIWLYFIFQLLLHQLAQSGVSWVSSGDPDRGPVIAAILGLCSVLLSAFLFKCGEYKLFLVTRYNNLFILLFYQYVINNNQLRKCINILTSFLFMHFFCWFYSILRGYIANNTFISNLSLIRAAIH